MEKLKPKNRKAGSRLRKAAVVFALAGASLLAGYSHMKCDRAAQRPLVETVQRDENQAPARTSGRSTEPPKKTAAPAMMASERRAEEVLMRVAEEFPYEGLDCELKPLEERIRFSIDLTDTAKVIETNELLWNQLKGSAGSALKDTIGNTSEPYNKGIELMCRMGFLDMYCPTELTEEIGRLDEENQSEALLSIVHYLNSLNLEWESDPEFGGGQVRGDSLGSLAEIYSRMYGDAHESGWEKAPSFGCVAKNTYALRILRESFSAFGKLMAKNPDLMDSALEQLPLIQQESLLSEVIWNLFDSDEFDRLSVEDFVSALSPASKARFIEALDNKIVFRKSQASRAEELAKYASDPELREVMGAVASKWRLSIKGLSELFGEQESADNEENNPADESGLGEEENLKEFIE